MKLSFRRPADAHISTELLSAYLDGQVSPAARAGYERHLQGCAACRSELQGLRQTVALLHALPRVPVPRAFTLSEARAGIRRPAPGPAWQGGLLRGLGAVAAVALVVVVASVLLRQADRLPGGSIAWLPSAPAPAPQMPAAAAPTEAPAEAQVAVQEEVQVVETVVVEKAVESTAAPAAAPEAAPAPAPAAGDVAARQAEPTAAPAAPAATATPAPALAAKALPPAGTPAEEGVLALGRGGGPGAGAASMQAPALTPEATPQLGEVSAIFPARAGVAYADLTGLWTIDRDAGVRQLLQADGVNTPQVSPDRTWIAYRIVDQDALALWVVRWSGGAPRRLLSERTLPTDGLGTAYAERRIQEIRWIPGKNLLSVTTVALPAASAQDVLPRQELWHLDPESAALQYVTGPGRAIRPFYAPDGSNFALLQYGSQASPEGSLSIFGIDGTSGRVALRFSAGPATPGYDSQLRWLPDSSGLLLAIPDADHAEQPGGTMLYRVPLLGEAQQIGQVDASQVFWAPDGSRMAYTRIVGEAMEVTELYLAEADGSGAGLYAPSKYGVFVGWSPDGTHFVYQDNYQVYLGAPGQHPLRLGNGASILDPRWLTAKEMVHLHDTGTGWLLVLRRLDGTAAGLLLLPREASFDVTQP